MLRCANDDLTMLQDRIAKCPADLRAPLLRQLEVLKASIERERADREMSEIDQEIEAQFDNMPV